LEAQVVSAQLAFDPPAPVGSELPAGAARASVDAARGRRLGHAIDDDLAPHAANIEHSAASTSAPRTPDTHVFMARGWPRSSGVIKKSTKPQFFTFTAKFAARLRFS